MNATRIHGGTLKRIIATLAIALAAALTFTAAPAQAEEGVKKPCEFSVPEIPDECLSEAAYNRILELTSERNAAWADTADVRESLALANTGSEYWRNLSQQLATDLQASRLATSLALSDVQSAYDEIDRLNLKVAAQRATIKRLRDRLRDLP